MWKTMSCIIAVMMLALFSYSADAQNIRHLHRTDSTNVANLPDSLQAQRDSIFRADSIASADSVRMLSKSSLQAPAFTAAKDSIIEDFSNGKRIIYYYVQQHMKAIL